MLTSKKFLVHEPDLLLPHRFLILFLLMSSLATILLGVLPKLRPHLVPLVPLPPIRELLVEVDLLVVGEPVQAEPFIQGAFVVRPAGSLRAALVKVGELLAVRIEDSCGGESH